MRRRDCLRQLRVDRPVLLRHEGRYLLLALDHHPQRDRLHAARRKPASHLLPEQRAYLVADEPVQDATRLLGIDEALVDVARVLEGVEDGVLRDFVEDDALVRRLLQAGGLAGRARLSPRPRGRGRSPGRRGRRLPRPP